MSAPRRAALLERAEEVAGAGSVAWCAGTDELLCSDNFRRLIGLEPEGAATLELLLERTHPDDRDRVERAIAAARGGRDNAPIELRVVRPDGAIAHLRAVVAVEETESARRRTVVAAVQDVTEQRRAERKRAVDVAVSDALAAWDHTERGPQHLLRDLARALSFELAVLWVANDEVLLPRAAWAAPAVDRAEFETISRRLRLPRGAGLPGLAWEQRAALTRADLAPDDAIPPRNAAAHAGFRSGVAIPALNDDEVLAVVDLRSREDDERAGRLMPSLAGVDQVLGAFLAGRRDELEPRERATTTLTGRELEILQLAADGVQAPDIARRLDISHGTVKTHIARIQTKLRAPDRASAIARALRSGVID